MFKSLSLPTPIDQLEFENENNVQLSIKRDDLNHPLVQGNKYRKLSRNLIHFQNRGFERVISFGGVFSNHVFALASASKLLHIPCTLFLRANGLDNDNPTVKHLMDCGVDIELLDYSTYRTKGSKVFLDDLRNRYPNALIIPEGGTNEMGVEGAQDLGNEIIKQGVIPDFICVSAGTGGTAAGLINAFKDYPTQVLAFSALKGDFLQPEIQQRIGGESFLFNNEYHFGGYAKFTKELIQFINRFNSTYGVPLEPVYIGKMMYGVMDLIKKDYFEEESKVMAIHTGGLQGIEGYNYMFASKYGEIIRIR